MKLSTLIAWIYSKPRFFRTIKDPLQLSAVSQIDSFTKILKYSINFKAIYENDQNKKYIEQLLIY